MGTHVGRGWQTAMFKDGWLVGLLILTAFQPVGGYVLLHIRV